MKKSSTSNLELREVTTRYRARREVVDLEFPVDAGFVSRPPHLSSTDYVKWCMEMMAALPTDRAKNGQKTKPQPREEFNL